MRKCHIIEIIYIKIIYIIYAQKYIIYYFFIKINIYRIIFIEIYQQSRIMKVISSFFNAFFHLSGKF